MEDKNITKISTQNKLNDVSRIDIKNGISVKDFIKLLETEIPFELIGEDILHFSRIDIKRINVSQSNSITATSKKEKQAIRNTQQSSLSLIIEELERNEDIKDLDITELEMKMLLAGETITLGNQQLSIKGGKLDIENRPPKIHTPKQKL